LVAAASQGPGTLDTPGSCALRLSILRSVEGRGDAMCEIDRRRDGVTAAMDLKRGIHRQIVSGGVSRPLAGSGCRGPHRHGAGAHDPDSPLPGLGDSHRDASASGNDRRDPDLREDQGWSPWTT
jgi:hypothetical protein